MTKERETLQRERRSGNRPAPNTAPSATRPWRSNHSDNALQYLREAVNRGYKNADGLMADENLKSLRQNPRFQSLVAELRRPPTKVQAQ